MTQLRMIAVLVILALIVGPVPILAQEMSPAEMNRAAAVAFAELVRNGGVSEVLPLIDAEDIAIVNPLVPQKTVIGPEGMAAWNDAVHASWPDVHLGPYLILADDEAAGFFGWLRMTFNGADYNGGPLGMIPANGNFTNGPASSFLDFERDRKIGVQRENWNSFAHGQMLGLVPAEPAFPEQEPWDVRIGSTSTSPAEHKALLEGMWAANGTGDGSAILPLYAEDVLIHDYWGDRQGADIAAAVGNAIISLPGWTGTEAKIVCEGDLCISYAIGSTASGDLTTPVLWSALHRFEDGKIVEEWWVYDSLTLYQLLDWPSLIGSG